MYHNYKKKKKKKEKEKKKRLKCATVKFHKFTVAKWMEMLYFEVSARRIKWLNVGIMSHMNGLLEML
jgi:hypothetical protein